jgi:hypothetical protein
VTDPHQTIREIRHAFDRLEQNLHEAKVLAIIFVAIGWVAIVTLAFFA